MVSPRYFLASMVAIHGPGTTGLGPLPKAEIPGLRGDSPCSGFKIG